MSSFLLLKAFVNDVFNCRPTTLHFNFNNGLKVCRLLNHLILVKHDFSNEIVHESIIDITLISEDIISIFCNYFSIYHLFEIYPCDRGFFFVLLCVYFQRLNIATLFCQCVKILILNVSEYNFTILFYKYCKISDHFINNNNN